MQMMVQRAFSRGSATRLQPRRGTFALEPVEALTRLSDRIARLSERALEPNPFFLPDFLEPAIEWIGRKSLRLALFSDRDELHFFAPVVIQGGQVLGGRRSTVWAHPYAPLGTPLIDEEMAPHVADALIGHMRTSGRRVFALPHLPLEGAAAAVLRAAAERDGFWTVAERQQRPILHPAKAGGLAAFDAMVSLKRRRNYDRQLRRLCEAGAVSFMTAHTASEIEAAFNMFIALEASGWKGRRGTALARREAIHKFARTAVARAAQNGRAAIDVMRVGDRPIAALIRFEHRGLSVPWKAAYDEAFSAYSPGKQLICDETRRWLADPAIRRVDPVCEEDNALVAPLWPERELYGTLYLSSRRWGFGARMRAGAAATRMLVKSQARLLLTGSKRRSTQKARNGGAA